LPANRLLLSRAFGFTKLVFNVQTVNFNAGKTFTTQTDASREHWKGNLAFSCQLFCHFSKTLPDLFEQTLPNLWQNTGQPTSKNHLDGKPP
jgi:hypothetical protein